MTSLGSPRHWTASLVEVGVGAEGALRDELLPARGALLVARSQRRDDAFGAKPEVRGTASVRMSLYFQHSNGQ